MEINGQEASMPRTILVHLNVELPDSSTAGPDEVADMILAAIEVGSDSDQFRAVIGINKLAHGDTASGNGAAICCPLAEEV